MNQTFAHYATVLRKDFTDFCNQRLAAQGLSQGQLYFVLYVGKHPGCSPRELTQALHMDAGHTTRTIAKLVQDGFLVQERNPTDGRAHLLRLTEHGEAAFRLSHELFAQWDEEVLQNLSAQERELLMTLLGKLVRTQGGPPWAGYGKEPLDDPQRYRGDCCIGEKDKEEQK